MSIGLVGFNKDSDKAEGAFGKAYQYFASVENTVAEGEIALQAAQTQLAGVVLMIEGGTLPGTAIPFTGLQTLVVASPTATLGSLLVTPGTPGDPSNFSTPNSALAIALIGNQDLPSITGATTVLAAYTIFAGNRGALVNGIAENTLKLEEGRNQINDANAGALTLMFGYITMMLVFGLIPLVKGTKKVIYGFCEKKETPKAATK